MNLSHSVRRLNLVQSFENDQPSLPLSSEATEASDSLEAVETCFTERILTIPGAQEHCSCRVALARLLNVEISRKVRKLVGHFVNYSDHCFFDRIARDSGFFFVDAIVISCKFLMSQCCDQ